ncbi:RagB/SusD family nutrient uptake outer membrane protein [Sphingobacterium wenxiniae]|uniref:SusD family protein n=1 Tax=Sphingobacterium wenxiniae TaxID=683125 RepID=A0A1I6THV4_9SPHI|nr:RagB/SusD family nutrient uptake outer membrane protein [Sphingobacterium wenxiniae]SFS88728.1 SusD family protein [Sphingobacterium wenxiniae]
MKIQFIYLLPLVILSACSAEFLEVKPQKQQVIVETLNDVTALLDNSSSVMNLIDYWRLISDGDLYYTADKLSSMYDFDRNLYLWKKDYDPSGLYTSAWDLPYQQIFYANIVIETIDDIKKRKGNELNWENLYGRALFHRAWAHYHALQDFAEGFDMEVSFQLGIPIIKDSSFPKTTTRNSLMEVYEFILDDLDKAEELLPEQAEIKTRASRQAVYSLKARVYQNLNDYGSSLVNAEKALNISNQLLDYNQVSLTGGLPFSGFTYNTHPEIIFFASSNMPFVGIVGIEVAEDIRSSYEEGDIRKLAYFDDKGLYIGTYSGNAQYQFTGLSIDELYLVKAECLVRLDRVDEGIDVLNTLLKNRYKSNQFTPIGHLQADKALQLVLKERQKELIGRGTRWTDLKRLNQMESTKIDLYRTYLGETYMLPAKDSRYQFEIPKDELEMSGLEPNVR